jgi:polyhydroxyalkanoate synthesis regulator phasin
MQLDDIRKTFEAIAGNLNATKAQQLAKAYLEPGAAKEQVAKAAADLLEWSANSRDRLREFVRKEIQDQMHVVGVATQADLDALKKRVRTLEREAVRKTSTQAKRSTTKAKPAARKPAANA